LSLLAFVLKNNDNSLTEIEKFRKEKKLKERNEKIKNYFFTSSLVFLVCFLFIFLFKSYGTQEERINPGQAAVSIEQETNSED
jgi:hypothetical protein